jgi:O-acetyl-ADP-ribose deacetylase (regulator of RNase III)
MIRLERGNLLQADAEALVNTVNTVGVMGKGIALQFKQAFPANFRAYESAVRHGDVQIGKMFVFDLNRLENPKFIINFPTKKHWRGRSRIEHIRAGLEDLISTVRRLKIRSIAIPPLGCGNGGLDWAEVRPAIETALAEIPDIDVLLFEPAGAPEGVDMKVATTRPKLTAARAAVLNLMARYVLTGYTLTMLEIQKLAYFLQAAGVPLRLTFKKFKFGPYAEELHHVLQRLEGHYIRGYGDRSRSVAVTLLPNAAKEAESALSADVTTISGFDRVARLIEGFETPYGMELLATVHWVATQESAEAKTDPRVAVKLVHDWNEHKKSSFREEQITIAWQRLQQEAWL